MKTIIIYDSLYGNTKVIAKAIAKDMPMGNVETFDVSEIEVDRLIPADFIIFGSPTHGGQPKKAMQEFLQRIPTNALSGKKVATFDTRFLEVEQKLPLRILMKTIGYAAPKMLKTLEKQGGEKVSAPQGFIVTGKEGSFRDGEVERAIAWGKELSLMASSQFIAQTIA